ncbi:MAG: cell wall-binding repeat-containing protein, partial [Gracilibacteraceae bacterium]|nr:cell wall-binding repeat-containing protein [Gracilibacteraceae bacterium]
DNILAGPGGGSVTVTGKGNYTGTATRDFDIAKADTTVTLTAVPGGDAAYGDIVTLTAAINGGFNPAGTVTFWNGPAQNGEPKNVSGGRAETSLTDLSVGEYNFTAIYSGDDNHNESQNILDNYDITKAAQAALTMDSPGAQAWGSGGFALSAAGGSGEGAVTFSAPDNDTLSVSPSGEVTILGAGSAEVTAHKEGDENYNPTSSAPLEIIIEPRDISEAFIGITGGTVYTGGQLKPEFAVSDEGAAITDEDWQLAAWGENIGVAGGGSVTISGKGNYAGQKTQNFAIEKAMPDYTVPTGLSGRLGQPLSSIDLSAFAGFAWQNGSVTLAERGTHSFMAVFTPSDTANYNSVSDIPVDVAVLAPYYQSDSDDGSRTAVDPSAEDGSPVSYIYGADRVGTSVAIAKAGWVSANTVILVPGGMDALSAAPLAGQEDAPILLALNSTIREDVLAEIARLGAGKAYVVGSLGRVVADQLKARFPQMEIIVLQGRNRVETAALIKERITNPKGTFVVGYDAIADAVSAASYAAANGYVIQIAAPDASFSGDASLGGYTLGGPALVRDVAGLPRLYGSDRYATNYAVRDALSFAYENLYFANGVTLVDALTGSALAAKTKSVILLAPENDPESLDFGPAKPETRIYGFGGPGK